MKEACGILFGQGWTTVLLPMLHAKRGSNQRAGSPANNDTNEEQFSGNERSFEAVGLGLSFSIGVCYANEIKVAYWVYMYVLSFKSTMCPVESKKPVVANAAVLVSVARVRVECLSRVFISENFCPAAEQFRDQRKSRMNTGTLGCYLGATRLPDCSSKSLNARGGS